jgi:catechol 2,3-dioxygenase-like lactoylglutathione lyase family enzyme
MASTAATVLHEAVTIFVVKDVQESSAYFRDALGFKIELLYGELPNYAGVSRDNIAVHLEAAANTRCQVGQTGVNVFLDDVNELYQELLGRSARILKPPHNRPWGMRNCVVADLDGNYICFGTPLRK